MPGHVDHRGRRIGLILALILPGWFVLSAAPSPPARRNTDQDVPRLLRQIRDEVLGLDRYPGEDFNRGEFHLGPGDDDTYKTHAVGILVKGEPEGFRMTIMISRLEPSRADPKIMYARDHKTVVCRFPAGQVEIVRSDYPAGELEELLPVVLKAVLDKKALLKLKR
jgi:hypothetical protein